MRDLSIYQFQIKKISKKLKILKNKDKTFEIFGSSDHKYKLLKPISIQRLEMLEQKYNINLPDEYVAFITFLGDGGAGPFYGLYPIEMALKDTELIEDYKDDICSDITKPSIFTSKKELKEYQEMNEKIEDYNERYNNGVRALNGTLEINSQGCSFRNNIILNGPNAGKVFEFCGDMVEDIFFNYDKFIGFLDWYERWLDNSIKNC
jgi:hypothetical protein